MAEEKEIKKSEEKVEEVKKAEPTISEDELLKTIQELTDIAKAAGKEEEEEEEEEKEEETEKSFTENFGQDETLEKAIEVSDFLAALVEQTETSLDGMTKSMNKISKSRETFDTKYIEGLSKLGEVIKGFGAKFDALDKRLQTIEQTPVTGPKTIMKSATVIEKSFTGGEQTLETLPRRKVIEAMEKAVVDGKIPDKVLIGFEADHTYALDGPTKDILKSYIG